MTSPALFRITVPPRLARWLVAAGACEVTPADSCARCSDLAQAMSDLAEAERRVDELRSFEREYRSRLIAYLEGLAGELTGKEGGK